MSGSGGGGGGALRIDAPTFTPNPWYGNLCQKFQPLPRSRPVPIPRSAPQGGLCDDDVVNHEGEEEEGGEEEEERLRYQHLLGSGVMNEIR